MVVMLERWDDGEHSLDVWRAQLDEDRWDGFDDLPAVERERAAGLREGHIRDRWVAARWALRGVLASYLEDDPVAIELGADARGKPRLAALGASLRFNLSHSGGLALVAVGWDREVGVDVERIEPRRNLPALARQALSAEEAERIETLPEDERLSAFHAAWTRREAAAKCLGIGLGAPLPEAPVIVENFQVDAGFSAALAVLGERMAPLRRFEIHPGSPPKVASFSRHSLGRVQCETTNRGGAAPAEMFKVQQWP